MWIVYISLRGKMSAVDIYQKFNEGESSTVLNVNTVSHL